MLGTTLETDLVPEITPMEVPDSDKYPMIEIIRESEVKAYKTEMKVKMKNSTRYYDKWK